MQAWIVPTFSAASALVGALIGAAAAITVNAKKTAADVRARWDVGVA